MSPRSPSGKWQSQGSPPGPDTLPLSLRGTLGPTVTARAASLDQRLAQRCLDLNPTFRISRAVLSCCRTDSHELLGVCPQRSSGARNHGHVVSGPCQGRSGRSGLTMK